MPYGYTSRRHEDETGLMYFRARYYDPSTGEFISRDPLEYGDGMSQYRGYMALSMVDPFGNEIQIKFLKGVLEDDDCMGPLYAVYNYKLSKASGSEGGYIVQRISVSCEWKDKCDSAVQEKTFSYLEAFYVPRNSTDPKQQVGDRENEHFPGEFVDIARYFNTPRKAYKKVVQKGEARYFGKLEGAVFADPPVSSEGGVGEDIMNWDKIVEYGKDTPCSSWGGPRSIAYDSRDTKAPWWDSDTDKDRQKGERQFTATFDCQCDCSGWITPFGSATAESTPAKEGK